MFYFLPEERLFSGMVLLIGHLYLLLFAKILRFLS